jgi:hypothetical protein
VTVEPNIYKDALKAIEKTVGSRDELIEASAAHNPEWVRFADRILAELLVRQEGAVAMIGQVKDGPPIDAVWVGEIGGVGKIHFGLVDMGRKR